MTSKSDSILRGSCFWEKYISATLSRVLITSHYISKCFSYKINLNVSHYISDYSSSNTNHYLGHYVSHYTIHNLTEKKNV